jgi:regulatory protein
MQSCFMHFMHARLQVLNLPPMRANQRPTPLTRPHEKSQYRERHSTIQSLEKKCLHTALRLLGRRDHSRAELAAKLEQRGFEARQIAQAIFECERMRYLDDDRFCRNYAAYLRRKGYGLLRIVPLLEKKGLADTLVTAAVGEHFNHCTQVDDCRRVLAKKMRRQGHSGINRVLRARLYRFLLNRGFAWAVIGEVLGAGSSASDENPLT